MTREFFMESREAMRETLVINDIKEDCYEQSVVFFAQHVQREKHLKIKRCPSNSVRVNVTFNKIPAKNDESQ